MHFRRSRTQTIWLVLACMAFFTVANASIFPLLSVIEGEEILLMAFMAACYGAIGAQMALLAIWCTLVPLHWVRRALAVALFAIVLYGAWAAGFAFFAFQHDFLRDDFWRVFATGLLCLPLLLLAAQTPLWIMRIWFRWRIVHRDDGPSTTFQPLGIRDLMIATAVIAMALAAAQYALSINSPSGDGSIVGLVIAAVIVMVISTITLLPAVLASLHARRLLLALGLVFGVDIAVVVVYVTIMVVLTGAPLDSEVFVGFPMLAAGFFLSLTVPLLIARMLGYRLLWGRR